jgi:lipopolysaccharide biosynthesis regulator YciM
MPIDDPHTWSQAAEAFKGIFDGLRSAISLVREVQGASPANDQQEKLISAALTKAEDASKIAEAEIAKALGYELCKCEFPPTPMLTVGFREVYGKEGQSQSVYECPKCGFLTSGMWSFTRTKKPA